MHAFYFPLTPSLLSPTKPASVLRTGEAGLRPGEAVSPCRSLPRIGVGMVKYVKAPNEPKLAKIRYNRLTYKEIYALVNTNLWRLNDETTAFPPIRRLS